MTHDQRDTKKALKQLIADYNSQLWPAALTYDLWNTSVIVGEIAGTIHRRAPRGFSEEPRDDVRAWMAAHPVRL